MVEGNSQEKSSVKRRLAGSGLLRTRMNGHVMLGLARVGGFTGLFLLTLFTDVFY